MKKSLPRFFIPILAALFVACAGLLFFPPAKSTGNAKNPAAQDNYTLISEKHLVHDYPSVTGSGTIMVVVEIPTGTTAKWEVDKTSGNMKWEFKKGKPRRVAYLGYP